MPPETTSAPKSKMGWVIGIIIIVIIIILIVSSGSKKPWTGDTSTTATTSPIRIGGALLLTGAAAKVGELQSNGINLAVDDINKAGGVNGRPVELVVEDAGYDPATAVSAYQALKFKGLHLFLIDGSPVVAATHKLVIADGNFTIVGGATAPSYFDDSDLTCRIALTAKNFGPAMADRLLGHGYKRAALLLPDNEYGRGLSDEFTKYFVSKGGTVADSEFYNAAAGTTDFRTQVSKLKSSQSAFDGLIFSNPLSSLIPMLAQMKEFGLNKLIVTDEPTLDNPTMKDYTALEGSEVINYGYSKPDMPTDTADTKAFKAEYRSRYNSDAPYFAAAAYDTTVLLANAVGKVGEDPKKIGDYISGLQNYSGVTGTFSFNSDCEVNRDAIVDTVKGGNIVQIQ